MAIATPTLRESLKRLYAQGRVTEETLIRMMNDTPPKLDAEDYAYITGKPVPSAEELNAFRIADAKAQTE